MQQNLITLVTFPRPEMPFPDVENSTCSIIRNRLKNILRCWNPIIEGDNGLLFEGDMGCHLNDVILMYRDVYSGTIYFPITTRTIPLSTPLTWSWKFQPVNGDIEFLPLLELLRSLVRHHVDHGVDFSSFVFSGNSITIPNFGDMIEPETSNRA
jgi:hypothetical protein